MAGINPTAVGFMAGMAASNALRSKAKANLGNALSDVGQALVCLEELVRGNGKVTDLAAWTAYGAVKQAYGMLQKYSR